MRCRVPSCGREAVATCTDLVHWKVCQEHLIPAACNGLYPKLFNAGRITIEEGLIRWKMKHGVIDTDEEKRSPLSQLFRKEAG